MGGDGVREGKGGRESQRGVGWGGGGKQNRERERERERESKTRMVYLDYISL